MDYEYEIGIFGDHWTLKVCKSAQWWEAAADAKMNAAHLAMQQNSALFLIVNAKSTSNKQGSYRSHYSLFYINVFRIVIILPLFQKWKIYINFLSSVKNSH